MNSRYFNGANAKFISQDPAFLAMGDSRQLREMTNQQLKEYLSNPQNLNTYSYALNNPIVNTDPTGNAATLAMPFAKIGAGILSGISATALGIGAAIGVLVFPRTANAPAITDAEREAMTPQPFIGPIMPADQSNDKIETPRGLAPDGVAPPVENPGELKVGPASRPSEGKEGGKSYWDSKGGEWRYFPGDERHNPHWDYNPHKPGQPPGPDGKQGNEWRNVPIGNDSPLKNNPSSNTPKK